jgi:hypothetical protein
MCETAIRDALQAVMALAAAIAFYAYMASKDQHDRGRHHKQRFHPTGARKLGTV